MTYHGGHYTEAGFYPRGSSATGRSGGEVEGADEYAYYSSQSSFHDDENTRVVVESTADGPFGLLYKLAMSMRGGKTSWNYMFFPWFTCKTYRAPPAKDFERTDEEKTLAELYNLDDWQLQWRRNKMSEDQYSPERFRKEYPADDMEPFLITGGLWYSTEVLAELRAGRDERVINKPLGWRFYAEHDPKRLHFIGGDPSGGVGADFSTAVVLRDDGLVVATYSDNFADSWQLAEQIALASAKYGNARVLVEENNHGKACLKRLEQLGVNLWKSNKDRSMWVDPGIKIAMVTYVRELIAARLLDIRDPFLIDEIAFIRMQKNGNVGGDIGHHDDLHSALYLAAWNARGHLSPLSVTDVTVREAIGKRRKSDAEERHNRIKQKFFERNK
jgi:hypothetical protein